MALEIPRLNTGIPGLDEMINKGFPFPSTILVAGGTGTGKTTFAMQFLFYGAQKGQKGLYFTTMSEEPEWMLKFMSPYKFVEKKYFGTTIKYVELGSLLEEKPSADQLLDDIEREVIATQPKRVVIDPITPIEGLVGEDYRMFLFKLSSIMKNWQAVTVITGESRFDEPYPQEVAYTMDGVILLTNEEEAKGRRKYLEVLKMRGTAHTTGKQSVDISSEGFTVHPGLR